MLNRFLFILYMFLLIALPAFTQTYFNKTYDYNKQLEYSTSVLEITNEGYLFVARTWDSFSGDGQILIVKVDTLGEILWQKPYERVGFQYDIANIIKISESNYILLSTSWDNNGNIKQVGDFFLLNIDSSGDTIWTKTYGLSNRKERSNSIIQTSDNGFAMVGWCMDSSESNSQVFVVKTDSFGNKLWMKNYGGINHEAGGSIIETPDNGFLIIGITTTFGAGSYDYYLLKVNSFGDSLWQQTYGTSRYESPTGITLTQDGNYLIAGIHYIGPGTTDNGQGNIIKIDSFGGVIWNKNFGGHDNDGLWWARELDDGNIVAVGGTNNTPLGDQAGWIIKIKSNGSKIWERIHNYEIVEKNRVDIFYNFMVTQDNGFILCGLAGKGLAGKNQDAWLMKVDSMGYCDSAFCYPDDTVSIADNPPETATLAVHPNPFSSFTVFSVNFPYVNSVSITLYNILGEKVKHLESSSKEITIHRDNLPSGIYFYQINAQGERLAAGKVVVE